MCEPLKRIPQRDWEHGDCGLACVAMLARVPYERALEAFRSLDGKKRKSFYTTHKQLEAMLKYLGHETERSRFDSWHAITRHAIVKVNVNKSGIWHWVVYDAGRHFHAVHDPKPGKRRIIRDFRGLNACGYYIALLA